MSSLLYPILEPGPAVTSQAKNLWWMAQHSHQSFVIGLDLSCDWLISLICNHYCTEKQLQHKKGIRKIKEVKNDTIRAVLSPRRPPYNARNQTDSYSHTGVATHTQTDTDTHCKQTHSKDQNFTGNNILYINMQTRQEECPVCQGVSSGNSFCFATTARAHCQHQSGKK